VRESAMQVDKIIFGHGLSRVPTDTLTESAPFRSMPSPSSRGKALASGTIKDAQVLWWTFRSHIEMWIPCSRGPMHKRRILAGREK